MTEPVVIVTGGLSGIGAAVAEAFAELRGRIVIGDLDLANESEVRDAVEQRGGDSRIVKADVRRVADLRRLVDEALEAYGRIDVLVACAGVTERGPIETRDPERHRAVVETNLLGSVYAVSAVLPTMLAQDSGHIVLIASVSGREWHVGEAVYIASKWGQVGLGHALRQDLLGTGIRVTLVEPGIVDTPLTNADPVSRALLQQQRPLQPQEIAKAVVFAYSQPAEVLVSEIMVRPLKQAPPVVRLDPAEVNVASD